MKQRGGWILYLSLTVAYLLTSDILYSVSFPDGRQSRSRGSRGGVVGGGGWGAKKQG